MKTLVSSAAVAVELRDLPLVPPQDLQRSIDLREVAAAVPKRKREYVGGRICAQRALMLLGRTPASIPRGAKGEPVWPRGVVGSITHTTDYAAAAVAPAEVCASLGIDAEPDEPLPRGVLELISSPWERGRLARCSVVAAPDRLLFSIKEAIYKAWYPLHRQWLGFEMVSVDVASGHGIFEAEVLAPGQVKSLGGRFTSEGGLVKVALQIRSSEILESIR